MDRHSAWFRALAVALAACFLLLAAVTQVDWVSQVRRKPWVDVRELGAKCDGTTDDSAALQTAINAMATAGGMVVIPPGLCAYGTTLNIQTQITLEGTTETTRYFPRVLGSNSIGSALYYTGSGNAIEIKNNGGTGVVGSTYVIRPQLRHLRIIPKNAAAYGVLLYNVQEFEIDHVNIESGAAGLDAPTGTFTRSLVCLGCNTHGRIHDGNFTGSPVLIDLQYGLVPVTGNSSLKVYNMNLFNASTAALKVGQVSGLSFHDNYIESAKNAFLIDNDATNGQGAFVDGLNIHDNAVYNSGTSLYANAIILLLQHTVTTIGVLVHNARITDNLFNSDAGNAYMLKAMYATSTAAGNDNADFVIERNDLWGGTTSALYSDSLKVIWASSLNNPLDHFWGSAGATIPMFTGTAGAFTDRYMSGGKMVLSSNFQVDVIPGAGAGVWEFPTSGDTLYNGSAASYLKALHVMSLQSDNGAKTFAGGVDGFWYVPATGGVAVGGSSGINLTCGAGKALEAVTISGGVITAGSCAP